MSIMDRQLLRQMFVKKLLIFSSLFLLSNLREKFQDKRWIKIPKWTIFEISFLWKHQSLNFHYWDYLTNFWRNNWQSIIDVVERLGFWLTSILWRLSTAKQQQPTLWIWRSLAVLCSITKECLSSYGTLLHAFSPTTHHYTPGTPTQLRLACSPFYEKGIFDF